MMNIFCLLLIACVGAFPLISLDRMYVSSDSRGDEVLYASLSIAYVALWALIIWSL